MKVVFFSRFPAHGYFSIERVFSQIAAALPSSVEQVKIRSRHARLNVYSFLANMVRAWRDRGEVNHVTGDIHYVTLLLPRRRTILTIHDCNSLGRMRCLKRLVFKWLWFDLPVWRSRFVTTVSKYTARKLLAICPHARDKIVVIHNPVDPRFKPCPKPFPERPLILQVGTAWNKNLERAFEALRGIDCRLSIIGALSESQREQLARCRIEYTQCQDLTDEELHRRYCECDMLLFASISEGFGMPIVEAQALGRPVVTSSCSSMPEVAGNAACYVNPLEVASIRRGVLRVINDEPFRRGLIEAGFINVQRFTPEAIAADYLRLYETIAGCPALAQSHPACILPKHDVEISS